MALRLVSRACPTCGGRDYKRCKPEGSIQFASDRKCTACGTKYKVPTPVWAAIIFLIIGLIMLLIGLAAVSVLLLTATSPPPIGLALFSCMAALGWASIWHGMRALLNPGKV